MSYMLGIDSDGQPVYSAGPPRPKEPIDESKVVDVTVTGVTDCDLCTDHYAWECPGCEMWLEHWQLSCGVDVKCRCGIVSRVTKAEHVRWRRDVLGVKER